MQLLLKKIKNIDETFTIVLHDLRMCMEEDNPDQKISREIIKVG